MGSKSASIEGDYSSSNFAVLYTQRTLLNKKSAQPTIFTHIFSKKIFGLLYSVSSGRGGGGEEEKEPNSVAKGSIDETEIQILGLDSPHTSQYMNLRKRGAYEMGSFPITLTHCVE